jgi:uncharacterized protein (TIGR02246 family)
LHEKIQIIDKPIEEFTNAWNRSDSKYFANLFVDDDKWTDVLGQHVRGKDQIKRLYEYSFKSVLKNGTLITRSKRIRFIRNSPVAIEVEWKSTGNKSPDGKLLTSRCGLPDLIVALENNIHDCKIILRHIVDYTTTYYRSDLIHDHMTINGIEGHEI